MGKQEIGRFSEITDIKIYELEPLGSRRVGTPRYIS